MGQQQTGCLKLVSKSAHRGPQYQMGVGRHLIWGSLSKCSDTEAVINEYDLSPTGLRQLIHSLDGRY